MNIFIALFFGALLILGLGGGFLLWSEQMARDAETRSLDLDGDSSNTPSAPTLAPVPDPKTLPGPGAASR